MKKQLRMYSQKHATAQLVTHALRQLSTSLVDKPEAWYFHGIFVVKKDRIQVPGPLEVSMFPGMTAVQFQYSSTSRSFPVFVGHQQVAIAQ